jgi:hypothetical protein
MMKRTPAMCAISALVMLCSISSAFAQYVRLVKASEVAEVKKRPVVILLEEENPKLVNKLSKKPEELAFYRSEIKRMNDLLPALANKLWSFTATPTTKLRSEIEKLKSDKNKEFAIISLDRTKVTDYVKDGLNRYALDSKIIATISIDLIENQGGGEPV